MKKIYKLKEWYSLEDAAERLTLSLSENVSVNDILELALENHLSLYWYMRHVPVLEVEFSAIEIPDLTLDIDKAKSESKFAKKAVAHGFFPVNPDGYIKELDGPHELLLQHCGSLKDHLLGEITGSKSELVSPDGFWVVDEAGKIWNIQKRFDDDYFKTRGIDRFKDYHKATNYYPTSVFPEISELGFTKNELERFEATFKKPETSEISSKERQTLLKMIIGMAKDGYGYNPKASRSPIPKELEGILDRLGIPVSDDTIRKWLKEAGELLPPDADA